MTTPVWVITGLLDSGKTTLINQLAEQELDELDTWSSSLNQAKHL